MPSGLHQHTLRSVNQNYRQVSERCTYRHVSGVFFMSGGVCNDKAAVVGGEVPVCHVNGDTLFPFCHQTVQQQGVVNGTAAAAHLAVQFQCLFLICVQQLCIIENMSDQRGFSVVYAAACDKFQ